MPSPQELRDRTKACANCPGLSLVAQSCRRTSIGAGNYYGVERRAASRARSKARVDCENRNCGRGGGRNAFWLEMLVDCEIVAAGKLEALLKKGHERSAIFTASRHAARSFKAN